MVHNSFAEVYFDKDYPKKIDTILAMQDKPSPRQQLSDGIFAADVVCSNDFVLVLKLSGNYDVACVSSPTADKLVERKWGLLRTDKTILGGTSVGCRDYFEIFYDKAENYRESQIIKQIRMTLSEFYEAAHDRATLAQKMMISEPYEKALWDRIGVYGFNTDESVRISINNCFSVNANNEILNDLKDLEHVKDAKASSRELM